MGLGNLILLYSNKLNDNISAFKSYATFIQGQLIYWNQGTAKYGAIGGSTVSFMISSNSNSRPIYAQGSALNVTNADGNAYTPVSALSFSSASSKLVKENINDITDEECLKLLELVPVNFDYKNCFGGSKNQVGLIAEDVEKILPKTVNVPDDYKEEDFDPDKGLSNKILSIDYSKFVPYIIKLLKYQQEEINELKSKLQN